MPIQPMLLVETRHRDKKAARFARRGTPVFAVIKSSPHPSDEKIRVLGNYGLVVMTVIAAILLGGIRSATFLIGFSFTFFAAISYYDRYSLELYERYQRKRNEMIDQRRVVELPLEMLHAWKRAYERIGIDVSMKEARMEFGRLCHDPHTRNRLMEQRRALIAADCEPCRWRAIAEMRNEMSAILQERIRDRQIDTRPGRLLL